MTSMRDFKTRERELEELESWNPDFRFWTGVTNGVLLSFILVAVTWWIWEWAGTF